MSSLGAEHRKINLELARKLPRGLALTVLGSAMQAAVAEGIKGLTQCWTLHATISAIGVRSALWSTVAGKSLYGARSC